MVKKAALYVFNASYGACSSKWEILYVKEKKGKGKGKENKRKENIKKQKKRKENKKK